MDKLIQSLASMMKSKYDHKYNFAPDGVYEQNEIINHVFEELAFNDTETILYMTLLLELSVALSQQNKEAAKVYGDDVEQVKLSHCTPLFEKLHKKNIQDLKDCFSKKMRTHFLQLGDMEEV